MRFLVAALVASVAFPLAANAQPTGPVSTNLNFTTISKSSQGGSAAGQKVVKDKAAYNALFGGTAPTTPAVDFTKEDVLVVNMGVRNTGGYGTEIVRIEHMNFGITGGFSFVHYKETSPAPGSIVTMALTAPRHIVKLDKGTTNYVFVNDTATPAVTTDTSLHFSHPLTGYEYTIKVEDSGKARLTQSSPTAHYMPLDGTATAAELAALRTAVKNADAATLPNNIPDPRMFFVAPDAIELTFEQSNGKTYTLAAHYDYYTTYEARVKPVVKALETIANRLKGVTPPAASFDKLFHTFVGGFVIYTESVTVSKDGAVTINRTSVHSGGTNKLYTGQATAAELAALKQAFTNADVKTLPKTINDPVLIMDIPGERLVSTIAGADYTCNVTKAGRYMTYDARLRPLRDALDAIKQRIITDTDGESIYGLVTAGANGVKIDNYTVPFGSPLYKTLKYAAGRNVSVQAHVKPGNVLDVMWVEAQANANVNVRSAAGWWGTVRATVQKNDSLKVTGESFDGSYYKVETYAGIKGWAYRYYVTVGTKP